MSVLPVGPASVSQCCSPPLSTVAGGPTSGVLTTGPGLSGASQQAAPVVLVERMAGISPERTRGCQAAGGWLAGWRTPCPWAVCVGRLRPQDLAGDVRLPCCRAQSEPGTRVPRSPQRARGSQGDSVQDTDRQRPCRAPSERRLDRTTPAWPLRCYLHITDPNRTSSPF